MLSLLTYRPTFKTTTPTSRTQLKQQLQREQLQELERQELERRENERKLSTATVRQCNNKPRGFLALSTEKSGCSNTDSATKSQQLPQQNIAAGPSSYGCAPSTPSTSGGCGAYSTIQQQQHLQQQLQPQQELQPHQSQPQIPQSAALKVPLHSVDLPPQVLKVIYFV